MYRFLLPAVIICLSVSLFTSRAEDSNRRKGKPDRRATATPMTVTPEREAAAMTFVKQHHPELAELLKYLKKSLPKQYDKAARDLFRTSERLAKVKDGGDERRYTLELELWQTRSRIQLLAARLRTRPNEKYKQELASLLEKQHELRLAQLEFSRDRAAARVDKLNKQIDQLKSTRRQAIEQQLRTLTSQRPKPSTPKPAATKRSSETASKVSTKNSDE